VRPCLVEDWLQRSPAYAVLKPSSSFKTPALNPKLEVVEESQHSPAVEILERQERILAASRLVIAGGHGLTQRGPPSPWGHRQGEIQLLLRARRVGVRVALPRSLSLVPLQTQNALLHRVFGQNTNNACGLPLA